MTPTLQLFLVVSATLFCIGLLAALSRRHAIFILIGIELMLPQRTSISSRSGASVRNRSHPPA